MQGQVIQVAGTAFEKACSRSVVFRETERSWGGWGVARGLWHRALVLGALGNGRWALNGGGCKKSRVWKDDLVPVRRTDLQEEGGGAPVRPGQPPQSPEVKAEWTEIGERLRMWLDRTC